MKKRNLWIGLLVGGIVIAAAAGLMRSSDDASPGAGAVPVETAGEGELPKVPSKPFSLKDAQGKSRALADFKGQAVLLHFWATWCEPCVEEIPALLEFARKLEGKAFRLLLVSMDESWEVAWTVLPRELPSNVVPLLDPESKVPELYGSFQFPESYLIDREQRIVIKWVGMQKWGEPYFKESVEAVLR